MTKLFAVVVSLALIVTVAVSPVWAAGDKVRSDKAAGPAGTTGGGEAVTNREIQLDQMINRWTS